MATCPILQNFFSSLHKISNAHDMTCLLRRNPSRRTYKKSSPTRQATEKR